MLPPSKVTPPVKDMDEFIISKNRYIYCLFKPITAPTAGVKIPVPATKDAATRVVPPVTTSIALTEKTDTLAFYFNRETDSPPLQLSLQLDSAKTLCHSAHVRNGSTSAFGSNGFVTHSPESRY